jgi:uncharacterized protein (TIGR03067 family)
MSSEASPHPIEGQWQVVSAVHAGEPAPELVTDHMEVEIARGMYCVRFQGKVADRGHLSIRAEEERLILELKGTEGPNRGRTIPAIVQHKGDRLRICYGLDGSLPTDFTSVPGSPRYLVFYRRKPAA